MSSTGQHRLDRAPSSYAEIARLAGWTTNPVNAAIAAFFDDASLERFAAVCDALADHADAWAEAGRDPFGNEFRAAVDRAQDLAVACGLTEEPGQDAVQAIMADAFRSCLIHRPRWIRFDLEPIMSEPPPKPLDDDPCRAAQSTLEAVMLDLRELGTAALKKRACMERLALLSHKQILDVLDRLIDARPLFPKINDDLLLEIGELL